MDLTFIHGSVELSTVNYAFISCFPLLVFVLCIPHFGFVC